MKISVIVTLKKEVLDPQGNTVQQTLKNMGYNNISQVRQGKFFEIEVDSDDAMSALYRSPEKLSNFGYDVILGSFT